MKKLLFLLAAVSVALTGCIKENGDYKLIQKVAPGVAIYNHANTQMVYAMKPADIAMKVAILAAEAKKQGGVADLNTLEAKVNNKTINVKNALLGVSATVTRLETSDYTVTYAPNAGVTGVVFEGVMTIKTGGKMLLEETDVTNFWMVTSGAQFTIKLPNNYGGSMTVTYTGGETKLFANGAGAYVLQPMGIRMTKSDSKVEAFVDGMPSDGAFSGAGFLLTPPKVGLAYSDCTGKFFGVEGAVGGPSFSSFDNVSATKLKYEVVNGKFLGSLFIDGTVTCRLIGGYDYDPSYYVKNYVEVTSVYDEKTNRMTQTVIYNGTSYKWLQ